MRKIMLILCVVLVASCDDGDAKQKNNANNQVNNINNQVNNTNNNNNINNANNTNNNTNNTTPGEAFELAVNLHDVGTQKMNLREKIAGGNLPSCDFGFVDTSTGPEALLCPDTTALNLGNAQGFYDVVTVPENAIFAADAPDAPVIGQTWQEGGTCETGYALNGNVYLLHLQDGTYAKIEMIYAKSGVIRVRACRNPQPDVLDLACTPPSAR